MFKLSVARRMSQFLLVWWHVGLLYRRLRMGVLRMLLLWYGVPLLRADVSELRGRELPMLRRLTSAWSVCDHSRRLKAGDAQVSALTLLARPGTARRGIGTTTFALGGLFGTWLAVRLPDHAPTNEFGMGLLVATALLIGWSNAASP